MSASLGSFNFKKGNMKKGHQVWLCTRCEEIVQVFTPKGKSSKAPEEVRCPDPKAPGGYWYCSFIELVPKKKRKVK